MFVCCVDIFQVCPLNFAKFGGVVKLIAILYGEKIIEIF